MLRSEFVAGVVPASAFRRVRYIGTVRSRLWRRLLPIAGLLIALPAGACSYQLGSMLGQDSPKGERTAERTEVTGSISATSKMSAPVPDLPNDNDLDYARAAAAQALAADGKSTPWENPHTGARGTITPIANAYAQDGFVCRDFLASYVHQGAESWLQGEGCRVHQGKWEVRVLRPWKKA
jgi:17 kDa outer membrane surface antigen